MSGSEQIKRGVETQDWSLVCRGYNLIFGGDIKPPSTSRGNDEFIQSIRSQIQDVIDFIDGKSSPTPIPSEPETVVPTEAFTEDEIDGEPPDVPTKELDTDIVDPWGQKHVVITQDYVDLDEVKINAARARITNRRKNKRPPAKTYRVTCTECNKTFNTPVEPAKGIGTKCSRCIAEMATSRDDRGE